MDARRKLFLHRDPYDAQKTADLFLAAVRENVALHRTRCPAYADILKRFGFDPNDVRGEADVWRIPPIPTLYFKRHDLFSIDPETAKVKATSSGTSGMRSRVVFDADTYWLGIRMMLRFFRYHRVISLYPTNYIVLGYEPSGHNEMGAAKTAYGTTMFAPALHREYALKDTGSGYEVNIEGIRQALFRYARRPFPVRFVGFPAYMGFLAKALADNGVRLRLHKKSKVLLGGGWKQFSAEALDRDEFFRLIEQTLGIPKQRCLEFYSAVEHPIPYCKCEHGNFHVPIYSRAVVRDVRTLRPLPFESVGLLGFVTPLVTSMPLLSVLTDDLAVLHDGAQCGCGIKTPYFELLGRAGVKDIKTCAATSAEMLGRDTR